MITPTEQEIYALLMAAQQAERAAVDAYRNSRDPDALLRDNIHAIIACSASCAIDYAPPERPIISEPFSWRENLSRTASRLQTDPIFHRMVSMQTAGIVREVERYIKAVGREQRDWPQGRPQDDPARGQA